MKKNHYYRREYLNIKNSFILKEWFKGLSLIELNSVINNFYYIGYGESSIRFLTYRFDFECFSQYVDSEKIVQYLNEKLIGNDVEAEIGEVLFLMPPCVRNANYQIKDLYKYCVNNNIKFNKVDEFVDK